MKNKLTKITSGFMFAVVSATLCAPAATASPSNEAPNPGLSFVSQKAVDQTANFASRTNKTLSDLSVTTFSAHVVLNDSSGPQVIDTTDNKQNLSDLLKAHGFDISNFRSSLDTALDNNYLLKNNENLTLFKSEASGTSSEVTLTAPVVKKDSNALYKGEEKVETAGKDGKALRTIITTKNLAADNAVNTTAKKDKLAPASSEEKLTVLIAPEAKVILVGTKDKIDEPAAAIAAPNNAATPTAGNSAASQRVATESAAATPNSNSSSVQRTPSVGVANGSAVSRAMAQIGKPYVYGAAGANAFDCSGLVQFAFGGNIPRTAYAQGLAGTPVNPANMQPGDLVYTSYHIGIYAGNGKMVHAATPATGVILDDVNLYLAQGYKVSRL
jgi:cell wall-associated NlpC family hydrolase